MRALKTILILLAIFILAMTSLGYGRGGAGGRRPNYSPYYWGWPYYYPAYPHSNPPAEYWYFCQDPEGYYPYVKECPGGWAIVVPPLPNVPPPPPAISPPAGR